MSWLNKNQDLMDNQFQEFNEQESGIDWDDKNMIEVHDYFAKINKKYGSMDTTELPYTMIQEVYDLNNKDVEASKAMVKHLNDTIESNPSFDKYGGGDYLGDWQDEFNNIKNELTSLSQASD